MKKIRERKKERKTEEMWGICVYSAGLFPRSRAIAFTFGLIPLGKIRNPLSLRQSIKQYYCCSFTNMAFALNNP